MAGRAQLNIRLSSEKDAVLRAAAFVADMTPGELARELVEHALEAYSTRAAVIKAMEARAEHGAEAEGKLTRLPRGASAD
jgi:hypothetical protein